MLRNSCFYKCTAKRTQCIFCAKTFKRSVQKPHPETGAEYDKQHTYHIRRLFRVLLFCQHKIFLTKRQIGCGSCFASKMYRRTGYQLDTTTTHSICPFFVQRMSIAEFGSSDIQKQYDNILQWTKKLINSQIETGMLQKRVTKLQNQKPTKFDSLDIGTYSVKWKSTQRVQIYKLKFCL